jgi:multiple sugar transport system ATP-binding protein
MTMGDRIVVMKDGYIMQADKPLHIYNYPDNHLVGSFIGSPSMNFFKVTVEKDQLVNKKFTLPMDESQAGSLEPYLGKAIRLGIRPEHFTVSTENSGITAHLEVSELMGNESYLYCTTGEENFIARVSDNSPREPGSGIQFGIQSEFYHFFDPDSGERII